MEYTQIDKSGQLQMVRARIRELEQQHFDLKLRLDAPGAGPIPGGMGSSNLQSLETSLARLHEMEQELGSGS